ncbi:MAG: haloacid dehalogenase, partial [Desulfobacteraceae bacterium]
MTDLSNKKDNGKIKPASIAFDIDGVIADTMTLFIDIARMMHDVDWVRYEDITSYNLFDCLDMEPDIIMDVIGKLLDGSYESFLHPIPGAADALGRLGVGHRILMVTARPSIGPIGPWMEELLKPYQVTAEIIPTGDFDAKTQVLLDRKIQYFVEDRLETCLLLKQAGITPILFKQ